MSDKKKILATYAALASQIIFGFSFMFTKIAQKFASPLIVIADRYIVAFVSLSIVMLITGNRLKINKNIWKTIVMSIFQPVLYFVFESYGIAYTTSGFSAVMISLIPVVSMIGGMLFLKEKPRPLQYAFIFLSVLGVMIITLAGNSDGTVTPIGTVLLFGAVISSATYNMISRSISSEFSVFERTYTMTIVGLIIFLFIAIYENSYNPELILSAFMEPSYMYSILYLGIASSVLAFLLLNYANTHLPVAKTTAFANITTVVSVFAGALFLDEKLTFVSIIAAIMIVVGVYGVQMLGIEVINKK